MPTILPTLELRRPFGHLAAIACAALASSISAQSAIREWGEMYLDSAAYSQPVVALGTDGVIIRQDGRIYVQGPAVNSLSYQPQLPPPGHKFVAACYSGGGLGLLDDGTVVSWPSYFAPLTPPALPSGVTYIKISLGDSNAMALRSDREPVLWGYNATSFPIPALPTGAHVVDVLAGEVSFMMLLDTGDIVAWGINLDGECNVAPLPPGARYVELCCGGRLRSFCLARRSDGAIVGWGNNVLGQCNVPPLPPGTSYLKVVTGYAHALALRSDGQLVAWGDNSYGQCNVPQIPPGLGVSAISAARGSRALLTNGQVLAFGGTGEDHPCPQPAPGERWIAAAGHGPLVGITSDGCAYVFAEAQPPAPPPGTRYVGCAAGDINLAFLRSDGNLLVTGDNYWGQCNVPLPPSGVGYIQASLSYSHTVALRTDGRAVAFGDTWFGVQNIPALPTGMSYTKVEAGARRTLLLRSDGQVAYAGDASSGQSNVPVLPAGMSYVDIATNQWRSFALRSDGVIVHWPPWSTGSFVPPAGVAYVEIAGGFDHLLARRSDGQIEVFETSWPSGNGMPPALEPGEACVQVQARGSQSLMRVGPAAKYVRSGTGCPGTLTAARLVPRDIPRIGHQLQVTAFNLPQDVGVLLWGWQSTAPQPLAGLGMPGCFLHVAMDAAAVLVGQTNQARFDLPIPDVRSLIGTQFFHQVAVLDPQANAFGFVLSDAAEGVVGDW